MSKKCGLYARKYGSLHGKTVSALSFSFRLSHTHFIVSTVYEICTGENHCLSKEGEAYATF
jgi:hypothetical protein